MKRFVLLACMSLITLTAYCLPLAAQQELVLVSPLNAVLTMNANVGASTTASIIVANIGIRSGYVGVTGVNRAEFDINADSSGIFLDITDTLMFNVTFTPNAVGTVYDTVMISGDLGTVYVVLMGNAQAGLPGSFTVRPTRLQMGNVAVNHRAEAEVIVANTSDGAETFGTNMSVGEMFSVSTPNPAGFELLSGQAASLTVSFVPTEEGTFQDTLSIFTSGMNVNVIIDGNGVSERDSSNTFTVSTSVLAFGSVILGQDTSSSFTVTNLANFAQSLQFTLLHGTHFKVETNSTPFLGALGVLNVEIAYSPKDLGSHIDTLFISNGIYTQIVVLTGNSIDAPPATWRLTPASIYFGPGQPGDVFTANATIVNDMDNELAVTSISIVGTGAPDFEILNPVTVPFTIAAHSSMEIELQSTISTESFVRAALIVQAEGAIRSSELFQLGDSSNARPDTIKVKVENVSGVIGGTANVVVTLMSDVPPEAVRGVITYEFNASVMVPLRATLASVIENGTRRVSFNFDIQSHTEGEILTSELFTLTLGDAESTPVQVVSLALFDQNDSEMQTVTYSNEALVSVQDANDRTVNANAAGMSMQIAPNPATSSFTATFKSKEEPTKFGIYNSMGVLVTDLSDILPQSLEGAVSVGLQALASGTYMLRLSSETGTIVRTFTKY